MPFGRPDGGDGGLGGGLWLVVDRNVSSLIGFKDHPHRAAKGGTHGQGQRKHGEVGEEHWLRLVLKLMADVALVGFPSVGKSTLISTIAVEALVGADGNTGWDRPEHRGDRGDDHVVEHGDRLVPSDDESGSMTSIASALNRGGTGVVIRWVYGS